MSLMCDEDTCGLRWCTFSSVTALGSEDRTAVMFLLHRPRDVRSCAQNWTERTFQALGRAETSSDLQRRSEQRARMQNRANKKKEMRCKQTKITEDMKAPQTNEDALVSASDLREKKSSHQINKLTIAWQEEGLTPVNCSRLHLVSFPA